MTKIFYIHGFNSSVNSPTKTQLETCCGLDIEGLTYDHKLPATSIKKMIKRVQEFHNPIIIASSLGGWYAEQISNQVCVDLILYNPSLQPETSLSKYDLEQQYLYNYKALYRYSLSQSARTVILCEDDETVSPKFAKSKYSGKANIILTTGGHRMTQNNAMLVADATQRMRTNVN